MKDRSVGDTAKPQISRNAFTESWLETFGSVCALITFVSLVKQLGFSLHKNVIHGIFYFIHVFVAEFLLVVVWAAHKHLAAKMHKQERMQIS